MRSFMLYALCTGLLLACAGSSDEIPQDEAEKPGDAPDTSGAPSATGDGPQVTYHGQIRALLASNCVSCHVEGGIGPMPLDDLQSVTEVRELVAAVVAERIMPPWPASDDCRQLRDVRALTDDQLALFQAWKDAGFPDGAERDYAAPQQLVTSVPDAEPTVVLMPSEAYLPSTAITDEYRCFVTEGTFDQDTYLTAMDIRPGVRAEVHHVQVHKIPAAQLAAARELDATTEGAGYPCAGAAGMGITSVNMFSWRPGSDAVVFEPGDAALIEAGSAFVLQVHYNSQFLPETGPEADRSGVAFWTLPPGELPERIVTRRGVFGPVGTASEEGGFGVIPAGESHVVGESTQPISGLSTINGVYVQGELIGMTPHMHKLGSRLSATLTRPEGTECMIDVPEWDAEWQLDYAYQEPASYGPDDLLSVRCEYDNSAANQPIVDGTRLTPRDVSWGEGSLDEMCLNYVWFRFDRAAFLEAQSK